MEKINTDYKTTKLNNRLVNISRYAKCDVLGSSFKLGDWALDKT